VPPPAYGCAQPALGVNDKVGGRQLVERRMSNRNVVAKQAHPLAQALGAHQVRHQALERRPTLLAEHWCRHHRGGRALGRPSSEGRRSLHAAHSGAG
jgi:hypothetical protein